MVKIIMMMNNTIKNKNINIKLNFFKPTNYLIKTKPTHLLIMKTINNIYKT